MAAKALPPNPGKLKLVRWRAGYGGPPERCTETDLPVAGCHRGPGSGGLKSAPRGLTWPKPPLPARPSRRNQVYFPIKARGEAIRMALVMRPDLDWDDVHVPGSKWRPLKEAGKAAERVGAKVRRKAAPAAAAAAAR